MGFCVDFQRDFCRYQETGIGVGLLDWDELKAELLAYDIVLVRS